MWVLLKIKPQIPLRISLQGPEYEPGEEALLHPCEIQQSQ